MTDLKGKDLEYLHIFAQRQNDDVEFWEMMERYSVLARLNRKRPVHELLDLSALNTAEKIENALSTSLACERVFKNHNPELSKLFRRITAEIERLNHVLN